MCRCCQDCWEDFMWNCFEEKFCYDESIANYNPEEDDEYMASQKNGSVIGHMVGDNNNLTVPSAICVQPLRRNLSINSAARIHESDYLRETQTNMPMLGPEILAVFANSQIFQDHQPTKLNRISTKTFLPRVHSGQRELSSATSRESDKDRLIKRLEGNDEGVGFDKNMTYENLSVDSNGDKTQRINEGLNHQNGSISSSDKHITFTLATDSSSDESEAVPPIKFGAIEEEESITGSEVLLRPRLIDRHPYLLGHENLTPKNQILRNAKSVPYFGVTVNAGNASHADIFSITGTGQISMTPEVPSISYSNLPKHYEDTPTIEKYRVSQSLYSIQTANATRAGQDDYSMPRYFRRNVVLSQSGEIPSISPSIPSVTRHVSSASKEDTRRPGREKNKRLQMLRAALPPLLIHSVSFRKNRDEAKQVD